MTARAVAVGRGARPVLSSIDLVVAPGERLALVGANGSGKTTLLRALAGLDAPLSGEILWDGRALPSGPARVRHVGVLFQGEAAPAFLVRQLVTLGLALDGPPGEAHHADVQTALDRFDLGTIARRPCTELSGGEWQRTALARSLVARPRLLLLDEPTSHLDPARRAEVLHALDRLRGDIAVVLTTHDLECAATCDRVLLIGGGRVVGLGRPAEVLTPALLKAALGVRVRRVDDPAGGAPFLRVEAGA